MAQIMLVRVDRIRSLGRAKLAEYFDDAEDAAAVEAALHTYLIEEFARTLGFFSLLSSQCRTIYMSRIVRICTGIQRALETGVSLEDKAPRDLVMMKPEDWDPARYQVLEEFATTDTWETMPDGQFKCRRCRLYKTTYVELQTRSADEPMTVFVTCHKCAIQWRL